jgi:hypothetical protein
MHARTINILPYVFILNYFFLLSQRSSACSDVPPWSHITASASVLVLYVPVLIETGHAAVARTPFAQVGARYRRRRMFSGKRQKVTNGVAQNQGKRCDSTYSI